MPKEWALTSKFRRQKPQFQITCLHNMFLKSFPSEIFNPAGVIFTKNIEKKFLAFSHYKFNNEKKNFITILSCHCACVKYSLHGNCHCHENCQHCYRTVVGWGTYLLVKSSRIIIIANIISTADH